MPTAPAAVANILMVDDRPANLLALEAILEPLGQRLVRAESGEQALNRLEQEDYAVILMDVRMPGMDGLKTAELIKRSRRSAAVPLILLTAVALDPSDITRGYARGAVDFLLKPFDPDILRSKVAVFVDLYLKEQMIKRQAQQLRQRDRDAFERRNEMRFRALIDALPQCVWAARTDALFHYWNKQAAEYTGIAVGSPMAVGSLLAAVHPEERDHFEQEWSEGLRNEKGFEIKFRLLCDRDRTYRWHLGRALPQRGESDAIAGWLLVATDIDSEQRALEKVEAASQMKDEFLATVSHELRNPLNAITGWAHLLRAGMLDEAGFAKAMETIERNAKLQSALIDDILDVSRITRGRINLNFQLLRLAPIAEAALAAIRPTADARGIALAVELEFLSDTITGDAERLQQIAWNLLSNAVKFTPRGGKVKVRLEQTGSDIKLLVSDTGQGISTGFLPFVFERFRQADSSKTRTHGGLGLGLAIVRHLAEIHGGTVSAESEGEGKGSTFVVTLPLTTKRDDTDDATLERDPKLSLAGVSVMIVEDDTDSREMLAEILAKYGAKPVTAASVAEAMAKIEAAAPQVLLSDIGMPQEDGYSLIRKIRERLPNKKMITAAVTGFSDADECRRILHAGFQTYFVKPIDTEALVRSIARLLSDSDLRS